MSLSPEAWTWGGDRRQEVRSTVDRTVAGYQRLPPGVGASQALGVAVSIAALGVFSGAAILLFAAAWRTGLRLVPTRTAA